MMSRVFVFRPAKDGFRRAVLVFLVAAFVAASLTPVHAAALRQGYAMCRDQGSLERLVKASVAADDRTVQALMEHSCTVIRTSQKVRVLTRTATLVHIAVGKRGRWWTVVEAVR